VLYDPQSIPCTTSYQHFAYTRMTVSVVTDALVVSPSWSTGFTIDQTAQCGGGGDD
jgi:hypothetical protein